MPQTQNNSRSNEDRPDASELIGTSKKQLDRQGKRTRNNNTERIAGATDSGGWFYQTFLGTASIIFVVLGLLALSIWGIQKINNDARKPFKPATPAQLISVANINKVTLSSTTPVSALSEQPAPTDGFSQAFGVYRASNQEIALSSSKLLTELNSSLGISPYLGSKFMYGQYGIEGEIGQYLIFSVRDYRSAYGSLLQHEDQLGNTFAALGFTPPNDEFIDTIIKNQDVRIATSTQGSLLYSFPRQNRLVITTNRATLEAIFQRLRQVQANN